jgi:hypothetical protein
VSFVKLDFCIDVQFENEGPVDKECGLGRACKNCDRPSMSGSTWDWCSTRTMTPRLGLRLKRLAVLVRKDKLLKGINEKLLVCILYLRFLINESCL